MGLLVGNAEEDIWVEKCVRRNKSHHPHISHHFQLPAGITSTHYNNVEGPRFGLVAMRIRVGRLRVVVDGGICTTRDK